MKKKVLLIAAAAILAVSAPVALSAMKSWPTNSNSTSWPGNSSIDSWPAEATATSVNGTLSEWIMVSDPNCGKCKMNDVDRKCGKPNCGGFMNGVDKGKFVEGNYLQKNYKCNKCGHTITCKNK